MSQSEHKAIVPSFKPKNNFKRKWTKAALTVNAISKLSTEAAASRHLARTREEENAASKKPIAPESKIAAAMAAAKSLGNKSVRRFRSTKGVGNKAGGTTAGQIVTLKASGSLPEAAAGDATQKYLRKDAKRDASPSSSNKQEYQNKKDFIREYIFSKLYGRLLYDRAPEINLVVDDKSLVRDSHGVVSLASSSEYDTVSLTSKFFPNFETLSKLSGDTTGLNGAIVNDSPELQKLEGFEKVIASCLLLGEIDYHASNIGVIKELDTNGKYKVVKIDHGRSGVDFANDCTNLIEKLKHSMNEFGYYQIPFNTSKFREAIEQMCELGRDRNAAGNEIPNEIEVFTRRAIEELRHVGMVHTADAETQTQEFSAAINKQLGIMKELAARLEVIEKMDLGGQKWIDLIGSENPITWAIEHGVEIENQLALSWAIDNKKQIDEKDPVVWLLENAQEVDGKEAHRWAVDNNKPIEGLDPARWIVENAAEMEGIDPMLWCVTVVKLDGNGVTIEGKDPLLWAAENGQKIDSLDPINWAMNNNLTIDGIDPIKWAVNNNSEEKPILIYDKDPIVYAQDSGVDIDGKKPMVWAIENKKQIEGLDPLVWAIAEGKQIGGEQRWNAKLHIDEQIGGKTPAQYCIDNNIDMKEIIAKGVNNYRGDPNRIEESYKEFQTIKGELYVGLPEDIAKTLNERRAEFVVERSSAVVPDRTETGPFVRRVLSERQNSQESSKSAQKEKPTDTKSNFGARYSSVSSAEGSKSKGGTWD